MFQLALGIFNPFKDIEITPINSYVTDVNENVTLEINLQKSNVLLAFDFIISSNDTPGAYLTLGLAGYELDISLYDHAH
jgi:hypothetical protein